MEIYTPPPPPLPSSDKHALSIKIQITCFCVRASANACAQHRTVVVYSKHYGWFYSMHIYIVKIPPSYNPFKMLNNLKNSTICVQSERQAENTRAEHANEKKEIHFKTLFLHLSRK